MAIWDHLQKLLRPESDKPDGERPPAPPAAEAIAPEPAPVLDDLELLPEAEAALPEPPPPPPGPQAGDFLPVNRAELLSKGADVRLTTGWMMFGRRDIIPPVTDQRTMLIDRGMLTQGIMTAEQLAEIHQTGEMWELHSKQVDQVHVKAGQSADAAVESDRAARAQVKAQKKALAARREKAKADAVTHRKATDIIFVGKGVSALMNDRVGDDAKLVAAGLPVVQSPPALAAVLGLTVPRLRWLCFHTEAATRIHYVQFDVPKKSGGTRTLSAPHKTLAAAQQWVLDNILSKLPVEEAAHGFVPGRSTLTNAAPHVRRDVVVNLDLEAFFPSISFARVRHVFRRLGYSGSVSTLLALLCTECPRRRVVYDGTPYFVATGPRGLPQGACTSPALSNQVARKLDRRLSGLARKCELNYTRYADDLTFSAGPGFREKVGKLLATVKRIASEEGFAVNPKKTRVQRPEGRQCVTGLVVNAAPAVPRDIVRRLRAILHRAKSEGLDAQNRAKHPNFRGWVEGMIAYIGMVKPAVGSKFRSELEELKD